MRYVLPLLAVAAVIGCRGPAPSPAPVADNGWPVLGWNHPRLNPVTNFVREPVFPPLPPARGDARPTGKARGDARPTTRFLAAAGPQAVTLAWLASPSPEVTGYKLYWAARGDARPTMLDVGATLTSTVSNLTAGTTYAFYATAYTAEGVESERSNEVEHTPTLPPEPPGQLRIVVVTPQQSGSLDGPWTPVAVWPVLTVTNPTSNVFYRYHISQQDVPRRGEGGEGVP